MLTACIESAIEVDKPTFPLRIEPSSTKTPPVRLVSDPSIYAPPPYVPLPPLHDAVERGDREDVARALRFGALVDEPEAMEGKTALHIAAERGHQGICSLLLANAASPDARDGLNATPLLVACLFGRESCANILLPRTQDLNAKDAIGGTALWHASKNGLTLIARDLLRQGALVGATDRFGYSELHVASHARIVKLLLSNGANPAALTNHGQNPLHIVCNRRFLVISPLNPAEALADAIERVSLLIEAGAAINARDDAGLTPLGVALDTDFPEVQKVLLAHGAIQ